MAQGHTPASQKEPRGSSRGIVVLTLEADHLALIPTLPGTDLTSLSSFPCEEGMVGHTSGPLGYPDVEIEEVMQAKA